MADSLRQKASLYAAEDPVRFVRTDTLGELNFESSIVDLTAFVECSKQLATSPLDKLPLFLLRRAEEAFANVEVPLKNARSFRIGDTQGHNPVDIRNQLDKALTQGFATFFDLISPVLAYLANIRLDSYRDTYQRQTDELTDTTVKFAQDANDKLAQITEILRISREAVQKVGMAQHARHFAEEALEHKRESRKWLWATIGAVAITASGAAFNLYRSLGNSTPHDATQSVQIVVAKLILFSLLFSAIVWCGRLYRAQLHNYVVNRHRQNALSSFEAFAEATEDSATKNAVLIQATQSIFSPQSSGYVDQTGDAQGAPQLIELIRTVANPK